MSSGEFVHFDTNQPKRRRAGLACVACHHRKIKCDIQQRRRDGKEDCTNCISAGRSCHIRPSKREGRRKSHKGIDDRTNPSTPGHMSDEVDPLLATGTAFQGLPTPIPEQNADLVMCVDHFQEPRRRIHSLPHQSISPRDVRQDQSPGSFTRGRQNPSPTVPSLQSTTTHISDVDSSGFVQEVYRPENLLDAENQALVAQLEHRYSSVLHPNLEQIFTETYFSYCYPWCPVLDRSTLSAELARSPLLANALALASSHVQPPLLPHDGPESYYKRARTAFYEDEESDELTTMKAVCLFYWWAPRASARANRHSSWWWTSVVIRHLQQMDIHRELFAGDPNKAKLDLSLKRRIWWTVFARERLTALCQSKPAIIDTEDCLIKEATLADFPNDSRSQRQGEIFIYWVRLCGIIGKIAKLLLQSNDKNGPFPDELREELVSWVHSLPTHLRLPIESPTTGSFDRDVHQLHLFYLSTIIVLHLRRSEGQLPQALPPAILAASCTARILRDILARGNSRFLMAITCWHVATACIALLQACRIDHLKNFANEDLDILDITAKQLQQMWASGNIVAQGMDRLRRTDQLNSTNRHATNVNGRFMNPTVPGEPYSATDAVDFNNVDDFDWMRFFPFVTKSTNGIAESLIFRREQGTVAYGFPSPNNELFHGTLQAQYQDLLDPFAGYAMGLSNFVMNP